MLMQDRMTEIEKWRSERVRDLYDQIQTIANRRGEILAPFRERGTGTLPEDVREQLAELDREEARIRQEIVETDVEARRRESEPVDPTPAIRKLSEELAQARQRRRWFCYQVHFRRFQGGYTEELASIERRIAEIENEIDQIKEAERFAAEQVEKED